MQNVEVNVERRVKLMDDGIVGFSVHLLVSKELDNENPEHKFLDILSKAFYAIFKLDIGKRIVESRILAKPYSRRKDMYSDLTELETEYNRSLNEPYSHAIGVNKAVINSQRMVRYELSCSVILDIIREKYNTDHIDDLIFEAKISGEEVEAVKLDLIVKEDGTVVFEGEEY